MTSPVHLIEELRAQEAQIFREDRRTSLSGAALAGVVLLLMAALHVVEHDPDATGLSLVDHGLQRVNDFGDQGGLWSPVMSLVGLFVAVLVVVALTPPFHEREHAGMEASRSRLVGTVQTMAIVAVGGLVLQFVVVVATWMSRGIIVTVLEGLACLVLVGIVTTLSSAVPRGLLGPALAVIDARRGIAYFAQWDVEHRPAWLRGLRRAALAGGSAIGLGVLVELVLRRVLGDPSITPPFTLPALLPFVVLLAAWLLVTAGLNGFVTAFWTGHRRMEQAFMLVMCHVLAALVLSTVLTSVLSWPAAMLAGTGVVLLSTGLTGHLVLRRRPRRLERLHARRIGHLRSQLERAERALSRTESRPRARSRRGTGTSRGAPVRAPWRARRQRGLPGVRTRADRAASDPAAIPWRP